MGLSLKWTKEKCIEEANKYSTKSDFRKFSKAAYDASSLGGWLSEITQHLKGQHESWTVDKCYRLALQCESRLEFSLKFPNAYDAASKRLKCLDDICYHMKNYDSTSDLRIIYCFEFEDKSVYVGLTKDFDTRERKRRNNLKDTVTQYINKTGLKPTVKFLTDFLCIEEAQLKEQEFIDKYRNEGYNILNKVRGGSLGSNVKFI